MIESSHKISGVINVFFHLDKLQLTEFPAKACSLRLSLLDLSNNNLSGLPSELGKFSHPKPNLNILELPYLFLELLIIAPYLLLFKIMSCWNLNFMSGSKSIPWILQVPWHPFVSFCWLETQCAHSEGTYELPLWAEFFSVGLLSLIRSEQPVR